VNFPFTRCCSGTVFFLSGRLSSFHVSHFYKQVPLTEEVAAGQLYKYTEGGGNDYSSTYIIPTILCFADGILFMQSCSYNRAAQKNEQLKD